MTPDPLLPRLAPLLAAHEAQISVGGTDRIVEGIPALKDAKLDRESLRISVQANVDVLNHLAAHPDDLSLAEPPLGALSIIHLLAHEDIPFHVIVRAYQIGAAHWAQQGMRLLTTLTKDPEALVSTTIALSDLADCYICHVLQRFAVEYEAERDQWRQRQESVRLDRIRALLDGAMDDLAVTEAELGYRLRHRHQALIVWADADKASGDELMRAQRVATSIVDTAGCRYPPLIVACGRATVWAWLPLPDRSCLDLSTVQQLIATESPRVRVAVGEPASGPDGFSATHRQAAAAHQVGLLAADERYLFPYREVSSLVFLSEDLPRARRWVTETLGDLALDAPREAELRQTVFTYLRCRSATATARALNCHKNTILYRLGAVERLLGYPVSEGRLDLDLSLLACDWIGSPILNQSGVDRLVG